MSPPIVGSRGLVDPRRGAAHPRSPMLAQIVRFAGIGVASTLAYVALYALLREWLPATVSNAVALIATAIGNTAANRRITFSVRGGDGMLRHQAAGLGAFGIALAITTFAIWLLDAVAPAAHRWVEIGVLVAANAVATAIRFLVLRRAILSPAAGPAAQAPSGDQAVERRPRRPVGPRDQVASSRRPRSRSAVERSRPRPIVTYRSTEP